MEVSAAQKHNKQQQFALASITDLYPPSSSSTSSSSSSLASPVVARFSADNGVVELRFFHESDATDSINVDLNTAQVSVISCFEYASCIFCSFDWLLRKWRECRRK